MKSLDKLGEARKRLNDIDVELSAKHSEYQDYCDRLSDERLQQCLSSEQVSFEAGMTDFYFYSDEFHGVDLKGYYL